MKYSQETRDRYIKQCMKRLYKFLRIKRELNLFYNMKQLNYFISSIQKIKTPLLSHSSIVYKLVCSGWNPSYIGKTERSSWVRTEKHTCKNNNQKEQNAIYEHLFIYENHSHIPDLFIVGNYSFNLNKYLNNVRHTGNNTTLTYKNNNWNVFFSR